MTGMDTDEAARAKLDLLAETLTAAGAGEQIDFYVYGRFPEDIPSSEHIGIRFEEGEYHVWYRDMGRQTPLVTTPDYAEAARVFEAKTLELSRARWRGRGRRPGPAHGGGDTDGR